MATQCGAESSACNDALSTTPQGLSVSSVASFLEKLLIEKASPNAVGSSEALRILQRFDSSKIPPISLFKYFERLKNLGRCCDASFLIALIYIDRIRAEDSNFALTERNVHRLFLTCTIVAEKYMNDDVYVNTYYAGVGGVCVRELNRLEAILLNVLGWRLGVSPEDYDKKQQEVRQSFADALSASRMKRGVSWKEWIVLKEAVCETQCDAVCVKQCSESESATNPNTMSGSTISGSTMSGSTMSGSTISDTTMSGDSESVSDSSETMGSSSEVA
jgi:hypothetical protein